MIAIDLSKQQTFDVGPKGMLHWFYWKLKSAKKNVTEVTKTVIGCDCQSNDETNFPNKLLLYDRQVLKLRKAFANNLSANTKLSKTQLSKIIQSGGFLGGLLGPLLKTDFPSIRNYLKPLAKSVLIPLGLTATATD